MVWGGVNRCKFWEVTINSCKGYKVKISCIKGLRAKVTKVTRKVTSKKNVNAVISMDYVQRLQRLQDIVKKGLFWHFGY